MQELFEAAGGTWADPSTLVYGNIRMQVQQTSGGATLTMDFNHVTPVDALRINAALPPRGPHLVATSRGIVIRQAISFAQLLDIHALKQCLSAFPAGQAVLGGTDGRSASVKIFELRPVDPPETKVAQILAWVLLQRDGVSPVAGRHHFLSEEDFWAVSVAQPEGDRARTYALLGEVASLESLLLETIAGSRATLGQIEVPSCHSENRR